ncbi:competence protein ComG [Listeria sp. FSL L7-1517]|uniref:competence protein ComG n=1 Tax=Listeria immobilis TaxID=2713502 RepID=UPI00164EB31B|nr:competence protein ComG [Listeria immobilis]MBC6295700.1 competence protein ComG [Listeria immobilis]
MKQNAFTLPFTIFIALITILIVTGSASIFKRQIAYEKMIQNYYLASAELNLVVMNAKEASIPASFTRKYGSSKIKCASTTNISEEYNCQILLENGYLFSKKFTIKNNKP